MLTIIVLIWVLIELSAPSWCFWFVGITGAVKTLSFCKDLVELGRKLGG